MDNLTSTPSKIRIIFLTLQVGLDIMNMDNRLGTSNCALFLTTKNSGFLQHFKNATKNRKGVAIDQNGLLRRF